MKAVDLVMEMERIKISDTKNEKLIQNAYCSIYLPTETQYNNSDPIISTEHLLNQKYLFISNVSSLNNLAKIHTILKCHKNTKQYITDKLNNNWKIQIENTSNIFSQYISAKDLFECITGESSSTINPKNINKKLNLINGLLMITSKYTNYLYYYPCTFSIHSKISSNGKKYKKIIFSSYWNTQKSKE